MPRKFDEIIIDEVWGYVGREQNSRG